MEAKHNHHHNNKGSNLKISAILNLCISIIQIIGGILSNSLALLSDSIHNLGDSAAIFGAWFAEKIGQKKPDEYKTYGYKRAGIIGAYSNALVLLIISLWLTLKAIMRLLTPEKTEGHLMLWVAVFGLLANVISVIILNKHIKDDLNVKGAYLHLISDTFSSVIVIAGAIIIRIINILWLDPLLSLIVNGFIIFHCFGLLKESSAILMQGVPTNINPERIKEILSKNDSVDDIHHIHIWTLDENKTFLECHVNLKENITVGDSNKIIEKLRKIAAKELKITHTTFQIEYGCNDEHSD